MNKVKSLWRVDIISPKQKENRYLVTDVADVEMQGIAFLVSTPNEKWIETRGEHFLEGIISIAGNEFYGNYPFKHLILRKDGSVQIADLDDYVHKFRSVELYLDLMLRSM